MESGTFVYAAEGTLVAADDVGFLTNGTYRIEWRLSADGIDVVASSSVPCEFLFPVTERVADAVSSTGDVQPVPVITDRGVCAFSTVGGFLYRYYRQSPAMSHAIGLRDAKVQKPP